MWTSKSTSYSRESPHQPSSSSSSSSLLVGTEWWVKATSWSLQRNFSGSASSLIWPFTRSAHTSSEKSLAMRVTISSTSSWAWCSSRKCTSTSLVLEEQRESFKRRNLTLDYRVVSRSCSAELILDFLRRVKTIEWYISYFINYTLILKFNSIDYIRDILKKVFVLCRCDSLTCYLNWHCSGVLGLLSCDYWTSRFDLSL